MTLLRTSLLSVALTGCSVLSLAAPVPTILPDNVVTCGQNARCSNKVMFGRNYKVIETTKFTVMVSISNEGAYTRADVSIANHLDYPQNVSPQDFRVEVVAPKPRVLLYVPPSELQNVAPPPPIPVVETPVAAAPAAEGGAAAPAAAGGAVVAPNIDELFAQAKKEAAAKEAAEKAAALQNLAAAPIPANEVVRGRVFFEKDPKAKQVMVVVPVAGLVFEFPYAMTF
jgi:hypothetical protein